LIEKCGKEIEEASGSDLRKQMIAFGEMIQEV